MLWLKSSQPPSTESLVVALINELISIPGDFVFEMIEVDNLTLQILMYKYRQYL